MMYRAGLVLEGGGMKGIYTAGVLDFFMDKEIAFSDCYGVSAGACHLCNFMSGQRGRSYRISVMRKMEPSHNRQSFRGGYELQSHSELSGSI